MVSKCLLHNEKTQDIHWRERERNFYKNKQIEEFNGAVSH